MKHIKFIRYGGLSSINHKKFYKMDTFHSPPAKKGIYAFIFPYIEDFLWLWKVKDDFSNFKLIKKERRIFTYKGTLWVHWIEEAIKQGYGIKYHKNWVKIHTNNFIKLFKTVKQSDRIFLKSKYNISDPYKRGLGGYIAKDHLEVFIEKI